MNARVVHVTASQNLAALIDNVYGELSAPEARGLLVAIDDAPDAPVRAAIDYLAGIGITVEVSQ